MFAVVHFVEDNTVEVVPMLWLVKSGNVSYLLNFAPCVCLCVFNIPTKTLWSNGDEVIAKYHPKDSRSWDFNP